MQLSAVSFLTNMAHLVAGHSVIFMILRKTPIKYYFKPGKTRNVTQFAGTTHATTGIGYFIEKDSYNPGHDPKPI